MCNIEAVLWGAKHLARAEVQGKRVLEVGSYDVNGTIRPIISLLEPAEYIGVDIQAGPGVDVICPAEKLVERFGRESFDLVVSIAALEHIRDWRGAVTNLKNVCKTGGTLFLIVPSVWPYHEYPGDYWRFFPDDIRRIFSDFEIAVLEEDERKPTLVYAKMIKPAGFIEADLADYPLYCVVTGGRELEVTDRAMQGWHARRMIFMERLKTLLFEVAKFIYLKFQS